MASFIFSTLLAFLPLSVLTSPLPTDPIIQSPSFRLYSRPLDASLTNLTDLYLESYHIYPAFDYAVLTPQTEQDAGRVGYLNGTNEDFENENAVSFLKLATFWSKGARRKGGGKRAWLTCPGTLRISCSRAATFRMDL